MPKRIVRGADIDIDILIHKALGERLAAVEAQKDITAATGVSAAR